MLAVIKDIEPRDQIEAMLKRPPEGGRRRGGMASRARLSQPELRHVPQRAGDYSAERRPDKRLSQAPDVAAHRREITLRWRERQRAGVLEAASSTLEGRRSARERHQLSPMIASCTPRPAQGPADVPPTRRAIVGGCGKHFHLCAVVLLLTILLRANSLTTWLF
jgi:hypothetical protein